MQKKIFLLVHSAVMIAAPTLCDEKKVAPVGRVEVDRGVAIVAGPVRRTVICKSQLNRPGMDGRPQSLETIIAQELAYQEAERMKMPISEAAQKHIQGLKKEHGLTDAQIDAIFEQAGRTREEGVADLSSMYAHNNMIDMKVSSRAVVSHEAVERYYQENPEYDEPEYRVQTAFIVGKNRVDLQEQHDEISRLCKDKEPALPWKDPVWLKASDISEEWDFITTMEPGQISCPEEVNGGFEVVRLLEIKPSRLIPLERRYKTIAAKLRRPQYERLKKEYEDELLANSHVVMLD